MAFSREAGSQWLKEKENKVNKEQKLKTDS